ncbi:PAS-domain containing protein [Grimontia marina]|uniref:histidine kinase n=1 Tax=Grimontia marina TaxID=646534 RepID=A0A128FGI4_9GAMM|nr:PAS-domain containing protein [Grimontia marina]CZF85912.1 Blue-light-activated protein [Grimontia marina]
MRSQSIRPHLMLTLSVLLLLTTLMAGFSLFTLWQNQFLLDRVTETTLADTQTALNLSEGVAQIAAMAPYTASSALPFQVQNEKAQLYARAQTLRENAAKLTDPDYAVELGKRYEEVERTLTKLMANVESELFIREDLMAQQFSLDELESYAFGKGFVDAFRKDPTRIQSGWITQVTDSIKKDKPDNSSLSRKVLPVLATLTRSNNQIGALRSENAFLLASIRAQSERMANYVSEIVQTHQSEINQQQLLARKAINQVALLMAFILLSLAVGVFYLYRFNDRMAKDLQSVTDEMISLASGNTEHEPINIPRQDEIGQLASAFKAFQHNAIEKARVTGDLSRQKLLLETLFHDMQDGLSAFDKDNRLLVWNRKYIALLGIDAQKLLEGMHIEDVQALITPSMLHSESESLDEKESIAQRHQEPQVFERQFKDGRIVEYRSQPIPSGGFITLYRDLTESRQIDLKLRQAQKMETLGQLTGGIAHDFNNLLSAQRGNLELLDMNASLEGSHRTYLNRALSVTEKGAQLVDRLLAFSRQQPLHPEPVNLEQTLWELADLLDYTLDGTSRLALDLSEQESWTYVDKSGLENALINMLLNANTAMPDGGTVTISTRACYMIEANQEAVLLEVSDTGNGIAAEAMNKVMEPFFTTKEKGQGSGLGLSMVYGFVEQSHGDVSISSQLGIGTQISMMLPLTKHKHVEHHSEPIAETILSMSNQTILLVDDDGDVAEPIKILLENDGLNVIAVNSAKDALLALKNTRFDVVLTDINLGSKETGIWLRKEALNLYPELNIVLMSGLPQNQLSEQFGYEPDWPLITKPISYRQLQLTLNSINSNS